MMANNNQQSQLAPQLEDHEEAAHERDAEPPLSVVSQGTSGSKKNVEFGVITAKSKTSSGRRKKVTAAGNSSGNSSGTGTRSGAGKKKKMVLMR